MMRPTSKATPWIFATSLALFAIAMNLDSHAQPRDPQGLLGRIDHLVYATPDLAAGVKQIEALLGIHATPGGQHPGEGTRNALVALGPTSYLEIIGPDPEQPAPAGPRKFLIDDLKEPRLVTWAAKGTNLTQLVTEARRHGVPIGDVTPGSRRTPTGVLLSWHISNQRPLVADGLVPFFIDCDAALASRRASGAGKGPAHGGRVGPRIAGRESHQAVPCRDHRWYSWSCRSSMTFLR
jgi:hypothetical protein